MTEADLKTLKTTVQLLQRAHFKELSSPQIMTAFICFQELGEMMKRAESDVVALKAQAASAPPVEPPKTEEKGKKKK